MSAPARRFWLSGLRIGISAALVGWLLWSVDWRQVAQLAHGVVWPWVAVAWGLHLFNRVLTTSKWALLLHAQGFAFSFFALLRIVFISNLLGHFLPSAIGGDNIRMLTVARKNARAPEAVSTVLMERFTGVLSLAALAVLGGLWSYGRWGEHRLVQALVIPMAVLTLGLLTVGTARGQRVIVQGVDRLHWLPGHAFLVKLHHAFRAYRTHRHTVRAALGISVLVQVVRVTLIFLLAKALGLRLFFGEALVLIPTILFISMLPISIGGLGVQEGAYVVLLRLVGVETTAAFGLSLLARLVALTANLPGGLFLITPGTSSLTARPDRAPAAARPIRVLHVTDKLGYDGRLHGVGRWLAAAVPALNARGLTASVCVLRESRGLDRWLAAQDMAVVTLQRGKADVRTVRDLCRLIRRDRVDVLHLHGHGASAFGRLAGALTGAAVVLHRHDTAPGPWWVRAIDRLLRMVPARIVAVSDAVKQFCVQADGLCAESITVIRGPLRAFTPPSAAELAQWRRDIGTPSTARLIGGATRFYPVKGLDVLMAALPAIAARVPQVHLVLWGDGPQLAQRQAQAQALGVADRVCFAGYAPDADRRLALLDCFVLSSRSEGSPLALLEALAAGCPIVATRVGGVPELVQDGTSALLVPPEDPAALAAAVIRVLTEPVLAERLCAAGPPAAEAVGLTAPVAALTALYKGLVR